MTTTMLIAMLVLAPMPQHGEAQKVEASMKRIASEGQRSVQVSQLFAKEANSELTSAKIPSLTTAFSNTAIRLHINKEVVGKVTWSGYWTPGRTNEIMTASWTSKLGKFTWVDNGQRAAIFVELVDQDNLSDENQAINFVEEKVQEILQTKGAVKDQVRHWLKPSQKAPTLWSGIVMRNVALTEVTTSDGKKLLKPTSAVEWDQHLQIATDGSFILIGFDLKDAQPNPLDNARTPDRYVPFRFGGTATR